MSEIHTLGIDVSKATFNVCLIREEKFKHKRFSNTAKGVEQLAHWLKGLRISEVHACLEVTGPYGESLAERLSDYGYQVSAVILAESGSIERFTNAKALAAYVGVAPRLRQSGQWKGRAMMSKTGRSQLRNCFFMPALVALRHNPVFIDLKKRLTAAGKAKMAIVGAAMRKLIHVIYGVLKTKTPFDPKIAAPGLDT